MGTMQRDKRILKERQGLARKKRHGIGRMGEPLWRLRQKMIEHQAAYYDDELLKALRGEPSQYPVINMQGVSNR